MWINSFCNQFFFCLYEEPEEAKTIYLLQIHTHTKIKKLEVNLMCNNEEKLRVGRETYPWGKKRYLKKRNLILSDTLVFSGFLGNVLRGIKSRGSRAHHRHVATTAWFSNTNSFMKENLA